ncbi:MAG: ABC transporter substrate-binding protein [Rhizobiales bacterium]|nr:ABC transporter substrate-binding protein [Hyphomicrobiales bacterium]
MGASIRWRLASSFPRSSDTIWPAMTDLADRVAMLTDGGFVIEPSPAGEPHAATDVLDLVIRGDVQCGHTAGSFFVDRDPVLALATFVPFGLDARRHAAWLAGPGAERAAAAWERQGLVALACGNTGAQTGGWFRRPVQDAASFSGLRIRTAGLPALVLERLGAKPRSLSASQILAQLRSGELDAADWIGPHDDRMMGFHRVAPFHHYPGVLEPSAQLSLVVGRAGWEALPDGYRAALHCAAAAVERALLIRYDTLNPIALAGLREDGVTVVRFPDHVVAALRRATAEVLDELAAGDRHFADALRSYRAFADLGRDWAMMGELDTARAVLGDAAVER